jgi:hypothetical protein
MFNKLTFGIGCVSSSCQKSIVIAMFWQHFHDTQNHDSQHNNNTGQSLMTLSNNGISHNVNWHNSK